MRQALYTPEARRIIGRRLHLTKVLKLSGYKASSKEVNQLRTSIMSDMKKDFDKYKKDIKEDISNGILSRYLPESMLLERSIKTDLQVTAAAKLVRDDTKFNSLLARENASTATKYQVANSDESNFDNDSGAKLSLKW